MNDYPHVLELRKLKTHGNAFDRKYFSYATHLPGYEEFWGWYIGCDVPAEISAELPITNIAPELDNLRKMIGQWNYIILLNYIQLVKIKDELELLNIHLSNDEEELNEEYFINNFSKFERFYLLATLLYYTSIECMEHIKINLKNIFKGKFNPIKEQDQYTDRTTVEPIGILGFKAFRDVMAHNVRPIVRIINKVYSVIQTKELKMFDGTNSNPRGSGPTWSGEFNLPSSTQYFSLIEFIQDLINSINHTFIPILKNELESFKLCKFHI